MKNVDTKENYIDYQYFVGLSAVGTYLKTFRMRSRWH